jgi:hypothetical protein
LLVALVLLPLLTEVEIDVLGIRSKAIANRRKSLETISQREARQAESIVRPVGFDRDHWRRHWSKRRLLQHRRPG